MIGFTTQQMFKNEVAPLSVLSWRSVKLARQTQSTLGAETMALARGLAEANWIKSLWMEATREEWTLEQDHEHKMATVAVIDSRPVYDHVHGDGVVVKDKRLAIEMIIVKRDLNEHGGELWRAQVGRHQADDLRRADQGEARAGPAEERS